MSTAHQPLEELRYALAEGDSEPPDDGVQNRLMVLAIAARPPGRPVNAAPEISPVEAYRRTAGALEALLLDLDDGEWRMPALRQLDAQGVVGHLLGVDRHLHELFVSGGAEPGPDDHIGSTEPFAEAQAGRTTAETIADWRSVVDTNLDLLERGGEALLATPVSLYGIDLPIGPLLIVRAFELWTHGEDIRRATGRPPTAPDTSTLQLMTQLAMKLVPAGMAKANRRRPGQSVRVVLTGPGGGAWNTSLGDGGANGNSKPTAGARIVGDAVAFCRLVANRINPADLDADISGDVSLAEDVLAGANALALD